MAARGLIDTGVILAFLDRRDEWHDRCDRAIQQANLPLLTSSAVLTELFHLAQARRVELDDTWRFLRSGIIQLGSLSPGELPEIETLMLRYRDRPMDFADATLVYLARRERLTTILTTDHADFETYRIEGKRKFRILPLARA